MGLFMVRFNHNIIAELPPEGIVDLGKRYPRFPNGIHMNTVCKYDIRCLWNCVCLLNFDKSMAIECIYTDTKSILTYTNMKYNLIYLRKSIYITDVICVLIPLPTYGQIMGHGLLCDKIIYTSCILNRFINEDVVRNIIFKLFWLEFNGVILRKTPILMCHEEFIDKHGEKIFLRNCYRIFEKEFGNGYIL